jgi:hypothetical protein
MKLMRQISQKTQYEMSGPYLLRYHHLDILYDIKIKVNLAIFS